MTWDIFKRLLWKVWREDWLKWTSVILFGLLSAAAAISCFRFIPSANTNYLSVVLVIIVIELLIAVIYTASTRGKKDSADLILLSTGFKIPSAILITLWSCIAALIVTNSMNLVFRYSYLKVDAYPYYVFLMVVTGLASYAIGIWAHPWLSAAILLPIFVASVLNYGNFASISRSQTPFTAFTIVNIAFVTAIVVIASYAISRKYHKRIPTIYQLSLAVIVISTIFTPRVTRNEPRYELYGGCSATIIIP